MPPSNSLLDNKLFNNLIVNRLSAQKIRSDNVESLTPSYLFSAIFTNSSFTPIGNNGTLVIDKSTNPSIIRFSDRPFRQSKRISLDDFIQLFSPDESGLDTFYEDPPNAVLSHNDQQQTYIITSISDDSVNGTVTLNLSLLQNETHMFSQLNNTTLYLFVDNYTLTSSGRIIDSGIKQIDCLRITTQEGFEDLFLNSDKYKNIELIILDRTEGFIFNFKDGANGIYKFVLNNRILLLSTLEIKDSCNLHFSNGPSDFINRKILGLCFNVSENGKIINKGNLYAIGAIFVNNGYINNYGILNINNVFYSSLIFNYNIINNYHIIDNGNAIILNQVPGEIVNTNGAIIKNMNGVIYNNYIMSGGIIKGYSKKGFILNNYSAGGKINYDKNNFYYEML